MTWIKLTLLSDKQEAEVWEELILATDAKSVTLSDAEDQPVFEPDIGTTPLWPNTLVMGLYEADINVNQVIKRLQDGYLTARPESNLPEIKVDQLEDKDWQRAWMDHFHPLSFGNRLWIVPSWCEAPEPNAVNILLDPGLAFGTGTHATTALCLRWLDDCDIEGLSIIDYGCGSGILGIASLLLGAKNVDAVDIDPQAKLATLDNATKNRVGDNLHFYFPDSLPTQTADIVIANILTGPLKELAPRLTELCRIQGKIVLSGLLERQIEEVQHAYQPWFHFDPSQVDDGWACLSATRVR